VDLGSGVSINIPLNTEKVVIIDAKHREKPILQDRNMEYKVEDLDIKVVRTPMHYEPLSDIVSQLPDAIQAIIANTNKE
jgi:hypothetical protein